MFLLIVVGLLTCFKSFFQSQGGDFLRDSG